jgi:hypothetical protein
MSIKGYPSSEKLDNTTQQFGTVQPIGLYRHALDVLSHQYVTLVNADAVEASSTAYIINATAHNAKRGMVIRMTSGATSGEFALVLSTTTNTITLAQALSAAPAAAVTFDIMRFVLPEASGSGSVTVTLSTAAKTMAYKDRHDYVVNVTTAAYTELIAATAAAINVLNIFDSSGQTMILATGAAASEVDLLFIPPGGFNAPMEIAIAAGTRLSIKALSANATSGEIVLNATN